MSHSRSWPTDEGDPAEEGSVVGGEDGGAEGEEGDDDAVQHHPRQQEPEKGDAWLMVDNAFSRPSPRAQEVN